jgi:transcriptional regulator with XRE-family HTH domain
MRGVRAARGWSAQQLADRCAELGMPDLDRSAVANIENERRQRIGVDELFVLALALGVAPVHLAVPLDEDWY